MTMPCPDRAELAAWLDHEVGQRRAEAIERHVAMCSVCTAQRSAIEQLIADLRAPVAAPPSPGAIRAVLARLDAPAPRAASGVRLAGVGAAFAAAVVAVLVLRPARDGGITDGPAHGRAESGFQARGGGPAEQLERRVGATLYALPPGGAPRPATPLAADSAVHHDTAFALGVRNLVRDRALWLLSFAIDADGEVHWLYPGYTAAGDDPAALPLAASDREIVMPDSVVLERPAAGSLRVVVVIAPAALRVSAIEALRGPELALAALQRRFPDAAISELSLRVVP